MTGFLNLVSQARPGIVVEFDLSSAKAQDRAPAVLERKFFDLFGRHRLQSRKLGRVGDETFRFGRENTRNFVFHCNKVWAHRWRFLPRELIGVRSSGGGLSGRFNFSRSARCALRDGVGPRTLGFSMSAKSNASRDIGTQISNLCAQRVFKPADYNSGQDVRWAHRLAKPVFRSRRGSGDWRGNFI
jgi:hypothetical protein